MGFKVRKFINLNLKFRQAQEAKKKKHFRGFREEFQATYNNAITPRNQIFSKDSEDVDESNNTKFYHYFAVPALIRENDIGENSDENAEDTFASSFIKHKTPKIKKQEYDPTINVRKTYITTSHISEDERPNSVDYANEFDTGRKRGTSFDPETQNDTIGEALFETTKLKGCKKIYYMYMFVISLSRFL